MRAEARHQLKKDSFASAAVETVSWATENQKKLIFGGVAIAVALAIILGLWFWNEQRDVTASAALGDAIRLYHDAPIMTPAQAGQIPAGMRTFPTIADRAREAQKQFKDIADKYGSTRSGKYARYFLALTYEDLNDNANAEKQLKDVAQHGSKPVAALAKYALAQLYASQNRDADAIKEYKDLIDHPTETVAKTTAQLGLAQLYETKQPQDAKRLYEQISKENPKTAAAETAQSRLSALGK